MRLTFERSEGTAVSRDSLTSPTRRNLDLLENAYGYQFEDVAYKYPVQQRGRAIYTGAGRISTVPDHTAYTIVLWGMGTEGEELVYVRRETAGPAAGQTLLYIDGKRHYAKQLIEAAAPTEIIEEL